MTRFRERDASCFQNKDSCSVQNQGGMEAIQLFPLTGWKLQCLLGITERERVRSLQCARAFAVLCCGRSVGVSGPLSLFLSRQLEFECRSRSRELSK